MAGETTPVPLPTRAENYQSNPRTELNRETWDEVFGDIGERLNELEAVSVELDEVISALRDTGLARLDAELAPLIAAKIEQIEDIQADIDQAKVDIEVLLSGQVSAANVTETSARVFLSPAQKTQIGATASQVAAILANAPSGRDTFKEVSDVIDGLLSNAALTGNPTAPTQTTGNNSTRLATTAFVQSALSALGSLVRYDAAQTLTAAQVRQAITNLSLPFIGAVFDYTGSDLPALCLWPDGRNVSRTTYAALFAKIGTTYGAGDGSTTFGLPDLRGRVIAGRDNMGGTSSNRLTSAISGINGANLGAAGGDERLHQHNHQVSSIPVTTTANAAAGASIGGQAGFQTLTTTNAGAGASQNVPPTIVLNKVLFAGA